MFENLTLLAVGIIVLWVAGLGYYLWVSRRHVALEQAVEALEDRIE